MSARDETPFDEMHASEEDLLPVIPDDDGFGYLEYTDRDIEEQLAEEMTRDLEKAFVGRVMLRYLERGRTHPRIEYGFPISS